MFGVFGNRSDGNRTGHNSLSYAGGTSYTGGTAMYDLAAADLPCPWCHAQTSDQDTSCPSCGRSFGAAELQL